MKTNVFGDLPMRPANEIEIQKFVLFLQLPLKLAKSEVDTLDLGSNGWSEIDLVKDYKTRQRTFFHEFAARPIFGDGNPDSSEFSSYRRIISKLPGADGDILPMGVDIVTQQPDSINGKVAEVLRFHANLEALELRTTAGKCDFLGLSVLTFKLTVTGFSRPQSRISSHADLEATSWTQAEPLNLWAAQHVLAHMRRVSARGFYGGDLAAPYDSPVRVTLVTVDACSSFLATKSHFNAAGKDPRKHLFPWFATLIAPIDACDDGQGRLFGDDRASAFSLIDLKPAVDAEGAQMSAGDTVALVGDPDLFRLAEADPPESDQDKTKYSYSPVFLKQALAEALYDRHAPHPETRPDRSTRFLFTEQHACMITCSSGISANVLSNLELYYRHMQFMCVFELHALLNFSSRLTKIIRTQGKDDFGLAKALRDIRRDFLTFTHIHHLTNVSPQIQPKEMFEKLSTAVGNLRMFQEVEAELAAAADFSIASTGLRLTQSSDRLQRILAIGVPAGLAVAVAALPFLRFETLPDIPAITCQGSEFWEGLRVFAGVGTVTFLLWWLFERLSLSRESGRLPEKTQTTSSAVRTRTIGLFFFILWAILTWAHCS